MSKIASILNQRFRKKEKSKAVSLSEKASSGDLTVFSGIFGLRKLGEREQTDLADLLQKYKQNEDFDCSEDLHSLSAITSEVKAINNQAAILHGERIKTAQEILKKYREGAFTAWLKATYGNRQTPYNFLQYYLFYTQTPAELHPQMESMPRQAIYTLASRQGEFEKKQEIIREYKGETKVELLTRIRGLFPLDERDGRRENISETIYLQLRRMRESAERASIKFSSEQRQLILKELKTLEKLLQNTVN